MDAIGCQPVDSRPRRTRRAHDEHQRHQHQPRDERAADAAAHHIEQDQRDRERHEVVARRAAVRRRGGGTSDSGDERDAGRPGSRAAAGRGAAATHHERSPTAHGDGDQAGQRAGVARRGGARAPSRSAPPIADRVVRTRGSRVGAPHRCRVLTGRHAKRDDDHGHRRQGCRRRRRIAGAGGSSDEERGGDQEGETAGRGRRRSIRTPAADPASPGGAQATRREGESHAPARSWGWKQCSGRRSRRAEGTATRTSGRRAPTSSGRGRWSAGTTTIAPASRASQPAKPILSVARRPLGLEWTTRVDGEDSAWSQCGP